MEQLPRSKSQHDTGKRNLEPKRLSETKTPARDRNLISMGINRREWPASTSRASEAKALQDNKRTIEDLRRRLDRTVQAKQALEKDKNTLKIFERQLNQALQDKQAIDERTRQKLECQLKRTLEDIITKETTIKNLQRQLNQALQEVNESRTRGENSESASEKKILVLFTGGTIGSVRLEGGKIVQPSEAKDHGVEVGDAESLLLGEYKKRYINSNIKFETKIIMETLSENMTNKKKEDIIKQLKEINFEEYDGIVLTHGTDTLAHTANDLATLLPGIKVPMILVSSNYVVTDERANGIENLKGAVDFISHVKLPGVYVTDNSKSKEKTEVIYGSRVTQCKPITDNYGSISIGEEGEKNMRSLGVMEDGKFKVLDKELFKKLKERSQVERKNFLDSIGSLNSRILPIHPYPGLNYDAYNLDEVDAVLHGTYHSGTACTDGDSESENLLAFAKKCQEKGVDLYLCPIYGAAGRDVYSSTAKFYNSGGSTMMNVSPENAYSKLVFAYSLFKDNKAERDKFIFQNINEEFVKPASKLERNESN